MDEIQPDWAKLGPLPTDPKLEEKLDRVKQVNNHEDADERIWIERSRKNAEIYAAAEERLFNELDKQLK